MAELGVCISEVVNGACAEFKALTNVVANDPATFDWELFGIFVGGSILMWVTGLGGGVVIKIIKRGLRF